MDCLSFPFIRRVNQSFGSEASQVPFVTVQVRAWGRPPVCQLAGPLARRFDDNGATQLETP